MILTITGHNAEILQISVLALVIVGTLIIGTALPLWVLLMDVKEASASLVEPHGAHGEGHGDEGPTPENEESVVKKGWLHRKWRHFDDNYIKKFLIHEDELLEQQRIRESMAKHRAEAEIVEERVIH